jgi:UDP-glucose 4-epimerase
VPFPEDRRAIDIGDYYADFGKAVRLLGWSPRVGPAEGLMRTVEFYREFGAHYV